MKKYQGNIFLIGPMGAGKSTIGRALAHELGKEFYDTDREIELRSGVNIPWIFDLEGEEGFRRRETKVIDELTQQDGIVLATGGGTVTSMENRRVLAARGLVIFLNASIEQQMWRVERSQHAKHDHRLPALELSDDLKAMLEAYKREREPLYQELSDLEFTTNGRSIRSVIDEIIDALDGRCK